MKLFVYGTLKRGCCRNEILQGKFLADVQTIKNYRLYNTGSFPAIVKDENGIAISGELWEVSSFTMEYLDVIEGVQYGMYARENIELSDGTTALAYVWQQSVDDFIDCGAKWEE